ncbi:MAG: DUF1573 domain-containing protein [Bacteroidales bacterium]|nr:DUF1573 domain-containing protein [Bacteroidales bacterium]NLK80579.1 DUF1573 domain-containing protein [Bacteroidales bacterium]
MKKSSIILSICIVFFACNQTEKKSDTVMKNETTLHADAETSIEFKETHVDFGTITQGEVVVHRYIFTNTGTENLKINRVEAACGCTASQYTTEVVTPGNAGMVEVKFDSNNRSGTQSKTVSVYANTIPARTVLSFTAEIKNP